MNTKWGVALGFVAVAVIAVQCHEVQDSRRAQRATLQLLTERQTETRRWQARYAQASVRLQRDVDTVKLVTTRYKTVRDSLLITDTVRLIEYIRVADSTVSACSALVLSCNAFRLTADSTIQARDREKAALREYAESVKPSLVQKYWWLAAVGGVAFGAWVRGTP